MDSEVKSLLLEIKECLNDNHDSVCESKTWIDKGEFGM